MNYENLLRCIFAHGNDISPNEDSSNPNRQQKIKELINVGLDIDGANLYCGKTIRPIEEVSKYLLGELAWYFSGNRRTELISKYSKFWEKIKNEDGTANSNYGWLIFYKKGTHPDGETSFDWACNNLMADKHSRQGLVLYNSRDFNFSGNKDYICSQYQHFLIRQNHLISIVGLRSSDAIFGLTYNMPWWSVVHQQMFLWLKSKYPDLKEGKISVNISSAHLYENKFKVTKEMLQEGLIPYRVELNEIIPLGKGFQWYEQHIEKYITISPKTSTLI